MDYQLFAPAEQVEVIAKLALLSVEGLLSDYEIAVANACRGVPTDLRKAPHLKMAVVQFSQAAHRVFGGDWFRPAMVAVLKHDRQRIALELLDEFAIRAEDARDQREGRFLSTSSSPASLSPVERANRRALAHRRSAGRRAM